MTSRARRVLDARSRCTRPAGDLPVRRLLGHRWSPRSTCNARTSELKVTASAWSRRCRRRAPLAPARPGPTSRAGHRRPLARAAAADPAHRARRGAGRARRRDPRRRTARRTAPRSPSATGSAPRSAYVPGSTGVQTAAHEAWRAAQGRLPGHRPPDRRPAAARGHPGPLRVRLPAPHGRTAEIGETVAGAEPRLGRVVVPATGSASTRPTACRSAQQHVVVGRGRDYGDVPPLKGVYPGPPNTGQGVEVKITRRR